MRQVGELHRLALAWGAVGLIGFLSSANPAMACLACIAMPAESLSDKVDAAEVVALLRPAPDDPFRYVAIDLLKGDGVPEAVPFLVSRLRAAELAADPEASVVATWSRVSGWAIHDFGTRALAATLSDLLARDLSSPEARRDAFGPLVDHADPAIARMAMVELATLPYPVLRTTEARIDRQEVARLVADPLWSEWAPVAIILLGLSDDIADRAFIQRATELTARSGRTAHLAAWATALIEADGVPGIDWVVATYISDTARSDTEQREAILALASHAARSDDTGRAVRDTLAGLAAGYPALAAALAQSMTERQDWSLAAEAVRWRDAATIIAPADAFLLTTYILAAEAAQPESLP
jgi:hypothetical protein